jgi:single-strand DNA-binding protein
MVMLVGRLVRDPEIVDLDGKKVSRVTLAVNRKFKGTDGIYHTDFIDCVLWNNFATNVNDYCMKGDLIGVRGRIQVEVYEKDGIKKKVTDVIAESITFLSSLKNKDNVELKAEN